MKNNRFRAITHGSIAARFCSQRIRRRHRRTIVYSLDRGFGITGSRGNVGTPLKQDYDVAIRINDKHFVGHDHRRRACAYRHDEESVGTEGVALEGADA